MPWIYHVTSFVVKLDEVAKGVPFRVEGHSMDSMVFITGNQELWPGTATMVKHFTRPPTGNPIYFTKPGYCDDQGGIDGYRETKVRLLLPEFIP